MSARVFHPMIMSEFQRMIGRNNTNNSTGHIDVNNVLKVRKNLFGPVDHEDNIALVERELAAANVRDTEKWGFDFIREKPVKTVTSRFVWERVLPGKDNVPEPYALRRLSYLPKNCDNSNNCTITKKSPIKRLSMTHLGKPTSQKSSTGNVKQQKITDFLKNRKRNLTTSVELKLRNQSNVVSPKKRNLSSSSTS